MENTIVYLVIGKSESGDEYQYIFSKEPTDKQLKKLVFYWDGDKRKRGCGSFGSNVYIETIKIQIDEPID